MTQLFHISHIRNLASIIEEGCILCDRIRCGKVPDAVGIAHQHIKDRRARKRVQSSNGADLADGGCLCDYVPFYFAPRSPMLYTIHRGNVAGYDGGQREVLHLVTSVDRICDLGRRFAFTDGHADMDLSEFYDDLTHLGTAISWDVMKSQYWNDTPANPDRKRQRQAEFLVSQRCDWESLVQIGVFDSDIKRDVEVILMKAEYKPRVIVAKNWYY